MTTYMASDQHAGDQGPRDNFLVNLKPFHNFLDYVGDDHLILAGDFLDFWQVNFSKAIKIYQPLLDRLEKMDVSYIIGNHDSDLKYFDSQLTISHPFFQRACERVRLTAGGKRILIVHGHEADPYCKSDTPDIGRMTAIASGLLEDKQGGTLNTNGTVVEDEFIGHLETLVKFYGIFTFHGIHSRTQELYKNYKQYLKEQGDNILLCGHTHLAGRIGNWYYNSGTWARQRNSFIRIKDEGLIDIFDWTENGPLSNMTVLQ